MRNIFFICLLGLCLGGCVASWRPVANRLGADLELDKDAEKVENSAVRIDGLTEDRDIQAETVILKTVAGGLYSKAEINRKTMEYIEKIEKQLKAYEANEKRRVTTIFIILLSVGVLSIVGGVAIIVFGSQAGMSSLGIQLIAMGFALAGVAYVMIYYAWIALTIGLAVLGGGVIWLIYKYIKAGKALCDTSDVTQKSLLEIIRSFDIIKELGWDRKSKAVVNSVQSPETQKLVSEIKENDKGK